MRTGEIETQLALDGLLAEKENEEWTFAARFVIQAFCRAGMPFTAEDIRERMLLKPPRPNLMGAVFRQLADEGWIVPAGYTKTKRPGSHGRVLAVWTAA